MRALILHAEHEMPRLEETPRPRIGEREVLVKVAAAGLNYADTMIRRGFYLGKPDLPAIPGFEYAGVVAETGEGVKQWKPGDRVMGVGQAAFAEYVKATSAGLMPVPEGFSDEEAAAFPVVYLTSMGMLRLSANVRSGETILVHAAAGGVGTATIQLARQLGLRILAGASTGEKLSLAARLGADVTINYSAGDWVEKVMEATGGRGADIIFESIGGDFLENDIRAAAPFGRIVVFGNASGISRDPAIGTMYRNSVMVAVFWLFTVMQNPALLASVASELLDLTNRGSVHPVIGGVYPLERAFEAFDILESRRSTGKLLLKP